MKTEDQLVKKIKELDVQIKEFYQVNVKPAPQIGERQVATNAAPLLAKRKELRDRLQDLREGVTNG